MPDLETVHAQGLLIEPVWNRNVDTAELDVLLHDNF